MSDAEGCDPMNMFEFPDWKVVQLKELGESLYVTVESNIEMFSCPHCDTPRTPILYGSKLNTVADMPHKGLPTVILFRRRRYRCRGCGRTFLQPIRHVDPKRNMTERLVGYLREQSAERTFVDLGRETGLHEKTVRNVFKDGCDYLGKTAGDEAPERLGLFEIDLIRRPRPVIIDLQKNTLIDILQDDKSPTIASYLSALPGKDGVNVVFTSALLDYRRAVRNALPRARLVIDKYYVLNMADAVLERIRRDVRAGLSDKRRRALKGDKSILSKRKAELGAPELSRLAEWDLKFPVLAQGYEMRELFYSVWDSKTKREARYRYSAWRSKLRKYPLLKPYFGALNAAVGRWKEDIFGYFDYEGRHSLSPIIDGLTGSLSAVGRGYSFHALRLKILNSTDLLGKPVIWRKVTDATTTGAIMISGRKGVKRRRSPADGSP